VADFTLDFGFQADPESCSIMATTLRSKGLGDIAIEEPLYYLRSCRNSQNLRESCVKLFIAKGKPVIDSMSRTQQSKISMKPEAQDLYSKSPILNGQGDKSSDSRRDRRQSSRKA
jgi:hypothetical protein